MKLQTPILFHTVEELQEAVKYEAINKDDISKYANGAYKLPTLFWDESIHQNNEHNELFTRHFQTLKDSVLWKDVKDQYRPKEWFEKDSSIDKPIWVRDFDGDPWELGKFKGYNDLSDFPYKDDFDEWKYAKPVKSEDLI